MVTLRSVALDFGLTDKEFLRLNGLALWHAEGGRNLEQYPVNERVEKFYRKELMKKLGRREKPQETSRAA